jgi:hypothetical protein
VLCAHARNIEPPLATKEIVMPDSIRHPLNSALFEHLVVTNGPRIKCGVTISAVEREGPVSCECMLRTVAGP